MLFKHSLFTGVVVTPQRGKGIRCEGGLKKFLFAESIISRSPHRLKTPVTPKPHKTV